MAVQTFPIYSLIFFGVLIYFMEHARSFKDVVLAFIKALFWPITLLYEIFVFAKM